MDTEAKAGGQTDREDVSGPEVLINVHNWGFAVWQWESSKAVPKRRKSVCTIAKLVFPRGAQSWGWPED